MTVSFCIEHETYCDALRFCIFQWKNLFGKCFALIKNKQTNKQKCVGVFMLFHCYLWSQRMPQNNNNKKAYISELVYKNKHNVY